MRLADPALYRIPEWQAAESATVAAIERVRTFATRRRAQFAVLLLPDEYQLDPALRAEIHRERGTDDTALRPRLVQERMTETLARLDVPVIDPFERFAAVHRAGTLFVPFDTHYDAQGNRLVAEELAAYLRGRLAR
jgi:hypothetical protein